MTTKLRPTARDAIIESAFAVLSRDPGASLSEIADRAGVGRATLHRHFAGRDELIRALALIAIAEMDEAADVATRNAPTYAEAIRQLFQALIPLANRHSFLAGEPIEDDPKVAAEFRRQAEEMSELIDAAKEEGLFDPAIPTHWIVQAFDHLLYAGWESVYAEETTAKQAADLAWRTLTKGVGA